MARVTDLGITIGLLPSGPTGSVLDVPGVGLGHATVWRDEAHPPAGRGIARTGVTVLDPGGDVFAAPVPAGGAVLNGAGECTGLLTAQEWGLAETPVFLTSTMQLGRVYDAACELLIEEQPAIGTDVIIPVVAECDDSFLNDARRMQVDRGDVRDALAAARASAGAAAAVEGAVGAGTGMSCLGYKGGIGTASRVLPSGSVVGVLTLTNFGEAGRLTVAGVPAGQLLTERDADGPVGDRGSSSAGQAGARRVVHRRRDHRWPAGWRRLPASGPPGRPGPGPGRQHRPPRQRRDLPRAGHRAPGAPRCGAVAGPGHGPRAGRLFRRCGRGHRGGRHQQPAAIGDRHRPGREHLHQIPIEELRSLVAGHPARSRA